MTRSLPFLSIVVAASLAATGCAPTAETRPSIPSETAVFEVRGMDCETCEHAIEVELRKLDGVLEVRASRADAVVVVEIDPERVEAATIESRIEKLGYEALLDTRHARDVVHSGGAVH